MHSNTKRNGLYISFLISLMNFQLTPKSDKQRSKGRIQETYQGSQGASFVMLRLFSPFWISLVLSNKRKELNGTLVHQGKWPKLYLVQIFPLHSYIFPGKKIQFCPSSFSSHLLFSTWDKIDTESKPQASLASSPC